MYKDLISVKDFKGVGMITASCDLSKLDIALNDAMIFDMEGLLCFDFVADILSKWREINDLKAEAIRLSAALAATEITPEQYAADSAIVAAGLTALKPYSDLIDGSEYVGCGGKLQRQMGFKTVWIYYAYSTYVKINPFNDSPNGLVHKSNEFSMPVPLSELNTFSTGHRNRARIAFDSLSGYLCSNKNNFAKFDACGCLLDCGCSGSCSCGSVKKIRGFKFKSISKK